MYIVCTRSNLMRKKPECLDHRQHISLSNYAYDIVVNDSIDFMGKKNMSGFINTIIANTKTDSIECLAETEFNRLKEVLKKEKLSQGEEDTIKRLAKAHMNSIIHPQEKYPKDKTLKIRLNNDMYDVFYESGDWDGEKHGILPGDYIKLLVERYARMTYFERESVYYKDEIEKITTYIKEQNLLKLTLKSGSKYYFKPYHLSKAYEANYHYLIGYSKAEGKDKYIIAPIRLSRIPKGKIKKLSDSGKITKKEKEEIEKRIKLSGIAYALSEPEENVIKLTPDGYKTYKNKYHQRPLYKGNDPEPDEDGNYEMTITATDIQIENYFFEFRGEAIVISPEHTRKRMLEWYELSSQRYKNIPGT